MCQEFEQLVTYNDFAKGDPRGVLNFKRGDAVCYEVSNLDQQYKPRLCKLTLKGVNQVYRVELNELEIILNKIEPIKIPKTLGARVI